MDTRGPDAGWPSSGQDGNAQAADAQGASQAMRRGRLPAGLALAAVVIALDQASKAWVLGRLGVPGMHEALLPWLDIVLAFNRGAAFSFLAQASGWQSGFFLAVGLLASGVLVTLLARADRFLPQGLALALVLGGALGNVIDRVRLGQVVDFIDVHGALFDPLFYAGHFPAFNVADSAISVGAALLVSEELWRLVQQRRSSSRTSGSGTSRADASSAGASRTDPSRDQP
jgi:signal peptidase II